METICVKSSKLLESGVIQIHGYKHAMVQVISASVALNIPVTIMNVPLVDDTFVLQKIIESVGGSFKIEGHRIFLDPSGISSSTINRELSRKIHGSLYLMPAFAIRFGQVLFEETGGCQIGNLENQGARPVEHIYDVMSKFGMRVDQQKTPHFCQKIANIERVELDMMSYSGNQKELTSPMISGATKVALLCATMSRSTTILNPYLKTDVRDLIRFLAMCGYEIAVSERSIEVSGTREFYPPRNLEFYLTECVSEVMTYIALAVHASISLTLEVSNVERIQSGLETEFKILRQMGVGFTCTKNQILIEKEHTIQSVDIDVTNNTIQSDHHPFFTLILLKGNREATIREFVWKDRFHYANELKKMGAKLTQEGNKLRIEPSSLTPGNQVLNASDTRAAAVLTLASLKTEGTTVIHNMQHLARGYENLLGSVRCLGARIE